jgi:Ras-related protein Rab-1A
MFEEDYDYYTKLIIIGDSAVGKTCILVRFSGEEFPENHLPTLGSFNTGFLHFIRG